MNERLPDLNNEKTGLPFSEETESDLTISFSKRFKETFRGLNNAEIARRLKTTDMTVKNYVDGNRLPNFELLVRIHRASGVNIHWLLTGKGAQFDSSALDLPPEQTIEIQHLAEKNGIKFQEQIQRLVAAGLDFLSKV